MCPVGPPSPLSHVPTPTHNDITRQAYLAGRETLRVVFHLIDSRHGPLKQDTMVRVRLDIGTTGVD